MTSPEKHINCGALLKQKDRETFDFLYSELNSQFYGLALQCLGERDLAEEMMIVTFTNIWRDLENFSGNQAQLKSWCVAVLMRSLRKSSVSGKKSDLQELKFDPADQEFIKNTV
ncbi:hypothetical protein ASG31_05250 [Chryseobacterium sp. Leaf404]|uniref:RNA polymerase sigma factor n=1 Tax=unclassified Chryseobacterium TaxID=2593645 RepID=UPI0006F54451|nr:MULTISPECIES: hypothetical protein [unclassified Chryseobacterium]KQT18141.1 hypothetical protein ASG31_05250 [Chryseobacterium sp. Leaf404]